MSNPFDDPNAEFEVVQNSEGQYSIWPTFREIPQGWEKVGKRGNNETCMNYIEENWTDMRPASLKTAMDGS